MFLQWRAFLKAQGIYWGKTSSWIAGYLNTLKCSTNHQPEVSRTGSSQSGEEAEFWLQYVLWWQTEALFHLVFFLHSSPYIARSYFAVSFPWIFNTSAHSPTLSYFPPKLPPAGNQVHNLQTTVVKIDISKSEMQSVQQTSNMDANPTMLWTKMESAKSVQTPPLWAEQ